MHINHITVRGIFIISNNIFLPACTLVSRQFMVQPVALMINLTDYHQKVI